jgi:ribosomal protein L39E
MTNKNPIKKQRLTVKGRQTRWAPIFAVLKKFGVGKRIHPSAITRHRRTWRRTKIHMKPRNAKPNHYG